MTDEEALAFTPVMLALVQGVAERDTGKVRAALGRGGATAPVIAVLLAEFYADLRRRHKAAVAEFEKARDANQRLVAERIELRERIAALRTDQDRIASSMPAGRDRPKQLAATAAPTTKETA